MLGRFSIAVALATGIFVAAGARAAENDACPPTASLPIRLHPDNPHYFLWRGKPTILVGSGEHYSEVLNRPFDYVKYLDTLQKFGLNHTRLFMGLYVEDNGQAAKSPQTGNSLDPASGQLMCAFARSDVPGYAKGGSKFDLKRWDESFFTRLKDFVRQASERGVVVEINLFCPYYAEEQWRLAPLNPRNNVNGLGPRLRTDVFTLERSSGLLPVQEAMVRRIAGELRDCDNIYYEICNEPYCGGISLEWQHHIADVIVDSEKGFAQKHLISRNVANLKGMVEKPHPSVSIFNFHYAGPPDTVTMDYHLNRPIGNNETGFQGIGDEPYRRQAWEFFLAGGALFSHLDYSFTVGHEDGSFRLPPEQWGGGSPALRKQFRFLKEFLEGFDFVHMKPDDKAGGGPRVAAWLPGGQKLPPVRALVEPGKQYAIYIGGKAAGVALEIDLPAGKYRAQWYGPRSAQMGPRVDFSHEGGKRHFDVPAYEEDLAMSIRCEEAVHGN